MDGCGKFNSCLAQDLHHPSYSYRPGWTTEVFRDNEKAQTAFSDLPSFLQRQDILALVPSHIRRRLRHSGDSAQLMGTEELFNLLDSDPDAEALAPTSHWLP